MSTTAAAGATSVQDAPHLATTGICFERILVATDFSPAAAHALKTAIDVAQLFHSRLYLVHASEMLVFASADAGPLPIEVLNANLDAARAIVADLVHADPRLEALQPEIVVNYATPVDLINEVAREEKIDLIIVGSHGAAGVERLALGSVAEAVLRKSSCPVLIVGPHSRIESDPFCSILFTTDLATTSLRAAQYAAALAEGESGKLTVLHVVDQHSPWPFLKAKAACDISEKQQLEELLPADIRRHCKERVRVEYGDPAKVITQVADEECAGIVVVGLKDRSALADRATWSTLSHIIHNLHCPVLGVRGHIA